MKNYLNKGPYCLYFNVRFKRNSRKLIFLYDDVSYIITSFPRKII